MMKKYISFKFKESPKTTGITTYDHKWQKQKPNDNNIFSLQREKNRRQPSLELGAVNSSRYKRGSTEFIVTQIDVVYLHSASLSSISILSSSSFTSSSRQFLLWTQDNNSWAGMEGMVVGMVVMVLEHRMIELICLYFPASANIHSTSPTPK